MWIALEGEALPASARADPLPVQPTSPDRRFTRKRAGRPFDEAAVDEYLEFHPHARGQTFAVATNRGTTSVSPACARADPSLPQGYDTTALPAFAIDSPTSVRD